MRWFFLCGMSWLLGGAVSPAFGQARAAVASHEVVVLKVDGIISPASSDFILAGIDRATHDNAQLVVIELDTPGGLDSSMRTIVQHILASPVPVATFVSPAGARAASAGTFILYASHIAAMTPASNLGAASPVTIGLGGNDEAPAKPSASSRPSSSPAGQRSDSSVGQQASTQPQLSEGDTMKKKIMNDAVAYIRSLAQLRGRNADFAEKAVRDAASLSAPEALKDGVIDLIADNLDQLLTKLDGRQVKLGSGRVVTLATSQPDIVVLSPDWRTRVLGFIADPQIALILLMAGVFGLFYEAMNPGLAVPGVAGLISLLLGLYAFQMLPVNWVGVGLIALGTALMIAEAFMPTFGVVGAGGVVAFVLGGIFLTDTTIPGYGLSVPFLIGIAVACAILFFIVGSVAARAHRRRVVTGAEEMRGLRGVVTSVNGAVVYAEVRGERWKVRSPQALAPGDLVRVVSLNGLTLLVEPADDAHSMKDKGEHCVL
ncbi:MAG TPA: nodulation protein NfeD [Burkholderiaceae bacterium]|nr:nodulation protein NfeD [Burkholderiaceae bacterium]